MELDLEKTNRIKWAIKNKDLESFSIISTEQDLALQNLIFNQSNSEMSYTEFLEYYNYLGQIMESLQERYNLPTISQNSLNKPVNHKIKLKPSELSQNFSLQTPHKEEIPEVYIIAQNGLCLFHFELYGEIKECPVNQNLVSGLLSAINSFAENMGWKKGLNLIRSGSSELRFSKGQQIIVAVLTHVEMKLSYLVEQILIDLANELGQKFEEIYGDILPKDIGYGVTDADRYCEFGDTIENLFSAYRRQTFELYQKLILTESIYLNAPIELCSSLIHKVTDGKSVIGEISDLIKLYPPVKRAIDKVNKEQKPMWQIFNIPIFQ
ncbi:hypothetical protein [Candidatus Lokiarchaeum ossiferum]|uniref:hypothetical protein n=1 Tax=Candidatus Lokiarchaeum ossiferum TaxID=2951803 RepID=UPI00352C3AAB